MCDARGRSATSHLAVPGNVVGATYDRDVADENESPTCCKCGEAPAGPGGVLCPDCVQKITAGALAVYDKMTAPVQPS